MMFVALSIGGIIQGVMLLNPQGAHSTFPDIVEAVKPWLIARSLSGVLLTVGHVVFAWHFVLMIRDLLRKWPERNKLSAANDEQEKGVAI